MSTRSSTQERHPAERKLRHAQVALQEVARLTDAGRVAIDPDRAAADAHERAVRELVALGREPFKASPEPKGTATDDA